VRKKSWNTKKQSENSALFRKKNAFPVFFAIHDFAGAVLIFAGVY
jgi:hypothetical protein